jgi:lysozyme
MKCSNNGIHFIASWEGFRDRIYLDVGGKPTIGFGHLIKPDEQSSFTGWISKPQGLDLLASDIEEAERLVTQHTPIDPPQQAFDALVSLVFNCGSGPLLGGLGRALAARDHLVVQREILRWCRCAGSINRGLENRRKSEAAMYAAGYKPFLSEEEIKRLEDLVTQTSISMLNELLEPHKI